MTTVCTGQRHQRLSKAMEPNVADTLAKKLLDSSIKPELSALIADDDAATIKLI